MPAANLEMLTGTGERPEAWYRFSVKCDRTMNCRIQAAAAKAGMSVTAFVQRHFDCILDPKPNAEASPAGQFDLSAFHPIEFSKRHKVSVASARAWSVLRSRVKKDGTVQMSQRDVAEAINCSSPHRPVEALIEAGLIEMVKRAYGHEAPIYRVLEA